MRILSITGSRSDYSLMSLLFEQLKNEPKFEHHLAVTGMLLNEDHTDILEKLKADGFGKIHPVGTFSTIGSPESMGLALGEGVKKFTLLMHQLQPEAILLQGDRGEMLAAAIAGAHLNIPLVHMSGGDRSGSIDDSIRNAISKFAHLHLTTCEASSKRLIEMGESPSRIITVGEPGVDVILNTDFLSRPEIETEFGMKPGEKYLLACLHPVTTEVEQAEEQILTTLNGIKQLGLKTIFTYPNNDSGADVIVEKLQEWEAREPWLHVVKNLGSRKYLSVLKYSSALIGNSSSGIWEAPTLRRPVVNIGTRQHMRLRADNVIDVSFDEGKIAQAIRKCLTDETFLTKVNSAKNPYGDGKASQRTVQILKELKATPRFIAKWLDS